MHEVMRMLAIRRLCIDLQLAPEAEPDLFGRNVKFEMPGALLWGQPSSSTPHKEDQRIWNIAEIHWQEIMLKALHIHYGTLGFPSPEILDGYTSTDPAALSRWYRRIEQTFRRPEHTQFWRLRRGRELDDGVYFISLYHVRRQVCDWMLWAYGYLIDLRFHPSAENEGDEIVQTLFKPMQRMLVQQGFPSLEGLPIEVTYERAHGALRAASIAEFFADVGIPLTSPAEPDE